MKPRIGRAPLDSDTRQVRGVFAERVVLSTALDPFLSIHAASDYASLREQALRDAIKHPDPAERLVAYRIKGSYLVRRSEVDAWVLRHRVPAPDLDALVEDIVTSVALPR